MPELPEIETIKLQLQKVLPGQILKDLQILNSKVVQGDIKMVVGLKIKKIERLGKVLLINFGENLNLGFHFKMTGQLVYDDGKNRIVGGHPSEDFVAKLPNSHTRVIFHLPGGNLYFNDQRLFGWVALNPRFVDALGPEPFEISKEEFIKRLSKLRKPIKVAIMDQEIISGVGNIYANDALWEAEIAPQTPSNKIQETKLRTLLEKIVLVLREGIEYGGASYSDYVQATGMGGHYQDHFRTYGRGGMPCLRCKTKIKKIVLGGRGTYYCPKCQT